MMLCRLLALTVAILAPALAQKSATPEDAIANLRSEWAKDLHDKKLDQIVMLYAPDAVFLPPNGERIVGRSAVRDLTFHSINLEYSGNLAYDSGEYRETLVAASDGNTSHGQGNYLMVYQRQAD